MKECSISSGPRPFSIAAGTAHNSTFDTAVFAARVSARAAGNDTKEGRKILRPFCVLYVRNREMNHAQDRAR